MNPIPLRTVLAPLFVALSVVAGFLQLVWNSDALLAVNLIFLSLSLWFGVDIRGRRSSIYSARTRR